MTGFYTSAAHKASLLKVRKSKSSQSKASLEKISASQGKFGVRLALLGLPTFFYSITSISSVEIPYI